MSIADDKLLPCPFCDMESSVLIDESDGYFQVVCSIHRAGCGSASGWDDSRQKVREAWNRRASQPDQVQAVAYAVYDIYQGEDGSRSLIEVFASYEDAKIWDDGEAIIVPLYPAPPAAPSDGAILQAINEYRDFTIQEGDAEAILRRMHEIDGEGKK